MSTSRPYVTLISEMTVDGKLTLKRGLSSKIIMGLMDMESQKFLHKKRTEFDAIMVGSNTIKIDNSILTNRLVEAGARSVSSRARMRPYRSSRTSLTTMRPP